MFDLVSAFLLFRPSYCQSLTFSHVISIFGHWCQHVLFFDFNLHRRNLGGFFSHLNFLYPRCTQTCGFWLTVTSTWWEQRYFGIQKNYIWVVLPNTLFKVPSFHINLGDNLSNLINIDFNKDLFPDVILRTHFLPILCPSDNPIQGPLTLSQACMDETALARLTDGWLTGQVDYIMINIDDSDE